MDTSTVAQFGALIILIITPGMGSAIAQSTDQFNTDVEQQHPVGATSPDTTVLRLEALIEEALRSNPRLLAAHLRADAFGTESLEARTLPDPTIGLTYQPRPILTARGSQRSQFRFEQTIPYPGKLRLRGDVADLGAEIAESEAMIVAEDLVFQIKQAYDELYRVQRQADLVRQFQAELQNFEEAAATRYEVGDGLQQSILKAQLERNALNIRLEKLEEEGHSALERLAFLLDRPDLSRLRGKAIVRTPDVTPTGDVLDHVLQARPEAEALRTEIERSQRSVDLAAREFFPDFTVSVNYFDIGEVGQIPTATGRDAVALSVAVKLPLWLGKQRSNLEQARLERDRAEARLQSLRTEIRTDIEDLRSRLARQNRQLALLENNLIPQARTTVEATLSAYSTGRTSFLDLLDAERMLFNLRMEQIDTRTRYLKTAATLDRSLGISFSR